MADNVPERHPPGLYVLAATEMWERFSFYSMLSMFTLYMRDGSGQGFGWSDSDATVLYSNYMMFVYSSPIVGGWLADRKLGHRRAVMIGGFFFMAGHLLLAFRSLAAVYAALACLVIGNGLFKPNVSTMVGSLYREGSHLKDSAYMIFYMGINVGALLAPIAMEIVKGRFGFHPAFAVAAAGMVVSVGILWGFQRHLQPYAATREDGKAGAGTAAPAPAIAMEAVPEGRRIGALFVVFLIVVVFWMVYSQNGSTLTYWADENTDWKVSGIISNSINPFWIITLTFPLVWLWKTLDRRGLEPSTPAKMAMGMFLTGVSFFILYAAALSGESAASAAHPYAFKVSPAWLIGAYFAVTLGELMLSPMGLSLVSKVAPARMRGLMMGCWFFANAIGNKLTVIGVYWSVWKHSTFFAVLGCLALAMSVVLAVLLRPLKTAMPGA